MHAKTRGARKKCPLLADCLKKIYGIVVKIVSGADEKAGRWRCSSKTTGRSAKNASDVIDKNMGIPASKSLVLVMAVLIKNCR